MDGLVLRSSKKSKTQILFDRAFETETERVREYSFDQTSGSFGSCIHGKSPDFLERLFQFTRTQHHFKEWGKRFPEIIQELGPKDFGFKVDWKNAEPSQMTLYLRTLRNPHQISAVQISGWTNGDPVNLPSTKLLEKPFCIGFRSGLGVPNQYCSYFEMNTEQSRLNSKVENLLKSLRWSGSFEMSRRFSKVKEAIVSDIQLATPSTFKSCIGIDSTGEVLKVDIAGASLTKVFGFLRNKAVPEKRIQELFAIARKLGQVRSNYFGLKFNSQGFVGWKVYLAVVGSLNKNYQL